MLHAFGAPVRAKPDESYVVLLQPRFCHEVRRRVFEAASAASCSSGLQETIGLSSRPGLQQVSFLGGEEGNDMQTSLPSRYSASGESWYMRDSMMDRHTGTPILK